MGNSFVSYTCERLVRNAIVGREIGRLGQDAGFALRDIVAFPTALRDVMHADQIFGLTRNARAATAAGNLAQDEIQQWLADLTRGPVLAAVTLFVTTLAVRGTVLAPVDGRDCTSAGVTADSTRHHCP